MRMKKEVNHGALLRELAGSLSSTVTSFEQMSGRPAQSFPDYKKARAVYHEIQAMIFTIGDKAESRPKDAPRELKSWLIRMRLRSIAAFTRVSLAFFRNPPQLLVHALGAYEILQHEREAFTKVLADYDMMLFEAGIDDKTADELDRVRVNMEEVVERLENLLKTAPPQLTVF
ncbi:hypothetical protein UAJ10_13060 [Nitrospirillum sp. BR 11164]|uniref:hypothetical protein n=1 Tax=Nitrospirillum sp. BR 11164 TaxID=3104324 RepID=UPI002B00083A|nr:hypothetical protein [Nitrospirillum sp. BR 11164]MEA1649939.1 hypothetical protein [Nitrospirillum sp. BR 11164]